MTFDSLEDAVKTADQFTAAKAYAEGLHSLSMFSPLWAIVNHEVTKRGWDLTAFKERAWAIFRIDEGIVS